MRRRRFRLGAIVSIGIVLLVCGIYGVHRSTFAGGLGSEMTVVASEDWNGQVVKLRLGDRLEVRLPAQLGTGYSWNLHTPAHTSLVLEKTEIAHAGQAKPGATDVQVFRFTAQSAGSTTLALGYRRPWERKREPERLFQLEIVVVDR